MKILLIEDNLTIAKGLLYSFKQNNYELIHASSLKESCAKLNQTNFALIILDITLPDGNGLNFFVDNIRNKKIPTIFLTAKDDEETIVKGLNMGAEDYLTKPFSTKELLARVNKIILRVKKNSLITIKDITFEMDKMIVLKNNYEIDLSPLEKKILMLLFLNLNKVVTRNTIINNIWDITGNDVDDHTVTVYIKRIRTKLGSDIIRTIKGIGYEINEE